MSPKGDETTVTSARNPVPEANIYARTLLSPLIRPDKVAIHHWPDGAPAMTAVTFGALIDRTHRVAALLRHWGIGPGDKVLILVPMSPELYAIILAVAQVGAIALFLDPWVGRKQLDAACAAAAPKLFFGVPKAHVLRLVSPAFRRIPRAVIVSDGWLGNTFRRQVSAQQPDDRVVPVDPRDPAIIAFTTGSTGRPKPVRRAHGYLVAMLDALNQHEAKGIDEIDMPAWPILLFDALCHGRTSVIPRFTPGKIAEADPTTLLTQMRAGGVSLLTGPPVLYERLLAHLAETGGDLPLRYAFLGGSVVSAELLNRVQAKMPAGKAFAVYGSTEVEPVASISAAEATANAEGAGVCVGSLHPVLEAKILKITADPIRLDERGWAPWEQGVDEPGEIVVSGPHVSVDYDEDPEAWAANKISGPDGRIWHRMGDAGYRDGAGRLWLLGRASHAIETADGVLFPVTLERAAGAVPGVRRAVLIAIAQQPWVVVVPDGTRSESDICAEVAIICAPWKIRHVVVQSTVPVDSRHNTKVDLDALRRQLADSGHAV
jgi:acyl-coenzyme A synthetase/AMP-(fatty) acid ligase